MKDSELVKPGNVRLTDLYDIFLFLQELESHRSKQDTVAKPHEEGSDVQGNGKATSEVAVVVEEEAPEADADARVEAKTEEADSDARGKAAKTEGADAKTKEAVSKSKMEGAQLHTHDNIA